MKGGNLQKGVGVILAFLDVWDVMSGYRKKRTRGKVYGGGTYYKKGVSRFTKCNEKNGRMGIKKRIYVKDLSDPHVDLEHKCPETI